MRLHTGIVRDELGRPIGAQLGENVPAAGRPLAQLRKRHGSVLPAGRLVRPPESEADRDRRLAREADRRRKEARG